MDHSFGSDRVFQPLSPALASVGARMVAFLHGGGRTVVLIGEPGSGKTQVLDAVVAGMQGHVIRVGNRLPDPLTLTRVLRQVVPPTRDADEPTPDDAEALLHALAAHANDPEPPVLVIDDAHTATPGALAALAHVRGLGMTLLLAGEPDLLAKLPDPGIDHTRTNETTLILMLGDGGLRHPAPPPRQTPRAPPPIPATRIPRWPAIGAALLATLAVYAFTNVEKPAPEPVQQAVPQSVPQAALSTPPPIVVATIAEPIPEPAPTTTTPIELTEPAKPQPRALNEAQARRDFAAFLDRAGRDTAALPQPAREALFQEYVEWRTRSAEHANTQPR